MVGSETTWHFCFTLRHMSHIATHRVRLPPASPPASNKLRLPQNMFARARALSPSIKLQKASTLIL
ncbi:hypothetical protein BJV78DRAFT_1254096 [Lactifluus subvellereus]|nr:hypothetical protein BJV78DRAFT_1254096 [Lactifluus subvellereus]